MSLMISYAQNFEDVMLARAFKGQATGFYVDVGASDPVEGSVTKHFYDQGWHGVNIEPVARTHQALIKDRPRDINLCVALGQARDTLNFFDFEAPGISTVSPSFADHFIQLGYPFRRRSVDVVPLREVCQQHCPGPIDFMKIDVEGWEKEVLQGGDWNRFRPRVLLIEATKPNSHEPLWQHWEPFVLDQGYRFVYFDGLNRFYVAGDDETLTEAFRIPPNVLDQFETYHTARLRQQVALLTLRRRTKELLRHLWKAARKRWQPTNE